MGSSGAHARGTDLQQGLPSPAAPPLASLQQPHHESQRAFAPSSTLPPKTAGSLASAQAGSLSAGLAGGEELLGGPLPVDLRGKTAFVAGVADSNGYGWAICKLLRAAGARVLVGTWPPVYSIFMKGLEGSRFHADSTYSQEPEGDAETREAAEKMVDMQFAKVYPLDAVFDTPDDVPPEIANNKRYAGVGGYSISEVAAAVKADGEQIDILVHSLANGPEVTRPLLQTSRKGYLAAVSSSSYSFVSMLQHFLPLMKKGSSALALSYIASERVIPGYGGGMSSAKAALESDCRTLAYEAGRAGGVRVNCISAGPLKSRAASAIGKSGDKTFIDLAIDYSKANAPLERDLDSDDVGRAALFLLSPLARGVTGTTLYVDNGLHAMGQALDSKALTP
ncbi:enoyl-[acyl-carrier-protein] reductase [NADH] 2, chloroplastic [Cyclospora cayetanensis]|uniref:Enoyl-[acyl-carrier-protein] reductase [NADH] 2, chloroplastic n=1 Tax=Cyclospora cayetanensis TaxID=88456 RepID=A0A6P6RXR9_9EIME|nr:enoyl-[acyl-carrier-protein] reductase [NADH] 2, chloroplastic [Cyclospora cayetanensis]